MRHNLFNFQVLTVTLVTTVIACTSASQLANSTTSDDTKNVTRLSMQDSSQYMTMTTTPASAVVEVVTLNTTSAKNETLKAQAQNQFPAGPFGGPFGPGQGQVPPQLIAALQRRQQLLQAQSE